MATDEQKLNYCEDKLRKVTINLFNKTITGEEFTILFGKYSKCVQYYRKKLNKSDLFKNNEDVDGNELLEFKKKF